MISITMLVLTFAALATSQSSTTVSIFIPNADNMDLVGSVAGADASATTYVVACASSSLNSTAAAATLSGMNSSAIISAGSDAGCGFDGSETITQGLSTYHWVLTESEIAAVTVDCALSGTTQAVCGVTATGSAFSGMTSNLEAGIPPLSTETWSGSNFPPFQQVVITAGLSNLHSSAASSTGSVVHTSTGHAGSTSTGTASIAGSTSKSSSGAVEIEPALAMGAAGMLAVGLATFAL